MNNPVIKTLRKVVENMIIMKQANDVAEKMFHAAKNKDMPMVESCQKHRQVLLEKMMSVSEMEMLIEGLDNYEKSIS